MPPTNIRKLHLSINCLQTNSFRADSACLASAVEA